MPHAEIASDLILDNLLALSIRTKYSDWNSPEIFSVRLRLYHDTLRRRDSLFKYGGEDQSFVGKTMATGTFTHSS